MWVDAIWMNQDDKPERNCQVLPVRTIYEKAGVVMIWLRERFDSSEMAMSKAVELTAHLLEQVASKCGEDAPVEETSLISCMSLEDLIFFGQSGSPFHRAWHGISKLVNRP